eukprot:CAMPEP_0179146876 /NCGR_PEP_ID=MMETSP0796-20121207/70963_1 /TAXON_ID=73915 /ORGANISM="Pyrodinium bahamense, Strain pbaha01" /LENGTH=31 /DNA_ID= /DNA_START= /DNA_END= /DNA_ORIENTATION=
MVRQASREAQRAEVTNARCPPSAEEAHSKMR